MSSESPSAEDVHRALIAFNWSSDTSDSQVPYEIWESPDGRLEALVPTNPQAGDYEGLMERAARLIRGFDPSHFDRLVSEYEVRMEAGLEETRWHKETPLPPGLIGWSGGEEMHQHAREQLVASAKATAERRRYHGNRSSFLARAFLDHSYMAVPTAGSFIISALTPATMSFYVSKAAENRALSSHDRLVDPEKVSGAEILKTYERALDSLKVCLTDYARAPRVDAFLEAVPDGVSYEMTKSLSELVAGGDTSISILRPGHAGHTKEIVFEAPEAEVLARATTALARDEEPIHATLLGEVTLLSRKAGGGDRVIRLDVASGGGYVHKARVRLTADQYEQALVAHQREAALRVQGRLDREGNLHWMYAPTSVEIVDVAGLPPAGLERTGQYEQGELPDGRSEDDDG